MTEEKIKQITELAIAAHRANKALAVLGTQNVAQTEQEGEQQAAAYAVAQAAVVEADRELRLAINS